MSQSNFKFSKKESKDRISHPFSDRKTRTARTNASSFFASFFTIVTSLSFGLLVGYLLSYYTFPGVSGQATAITVPTTPKTPYVEDIQGEYYLLSAREKRNVFNLLETKEGIPDFLFMEKVSTPQSLTPQRSLSGEPYIEIPDQWFSSGYAYTIADTLPLTDASTVAEGFTQVELSTGKGSTLNISGRLRGEEPTLDRRKVIENFADYASEVELFCCTNTVGQDTGGVKSKAGSGVVNIFPQGKSWEAHAGTQPSAFPISTEMYEAIMATVDVPRSKVMKNLTGRSSDLAYFLYYLDTLQLEDISQGRHIAATGVIATSGNVEAIGSVGAKFDAFFEKTRHLPEGKVFLYPEVNKAELTEHLTSNYHQEELLRVVAVPVSNIRQAVVVLREKEASHLDISSHSVLE